jgi:hypothetical protein
VQLHSLRSLRVATARLSCVRLWAVCPRCVLPSGVQLLWWLVLVGLEEQAFYEHVTQAMQHAHPTHAWPARFMPAYYGETEHNGCSFINIENLLDGCVLANCRLHSTHTHPTSHRLLFLA